MKAITNNGSFFKLKGARYDTKWADKSPTIAAPKPWNRSREISWLHRVRFCLIHFILRTWPARSSRRACWGRSWSCWEPAAPRGGPCARASLWHTCTTSQKIEFPLEQLDTLYVHTVLRLRALLLFSDIGNAVHNLDIFMFLPDPVRSRSYEQIKWCGSASLFSIPG